jgi:sulfatase maturation enzyme AslB (radical SAM superfamily)
MNSPSGPDAGIGLVALRELWLHTGTACNLSCPFCHEASAPGDSRLGALSFEQASRAIDSAVALGVETLAFTGGEPLILRGILDILAYAQRVRPCLVLTNGTAPLLRRAQHLARLSAGRHPVRFRVSIDYPDEQRHDAGRGLKTFRKAVEGLRLLHEAGFEVGITRMGEPGEDSKQIHARFRSLLRRNGLPEDLQIVALPELGRPGQALLASCAGGPHTPTCGRARMGIVRNGTLTYLPCPLVDDVPEMDLGCDLAAAAHHVVRPFHERCRACLAAGVDYAGVDVARAIGHR